MIVERIREAKSRRIQQWPVNSNRASELGHECLRYLVLNRTRWQEKTLHDVHLQMIFDMGRVVERSVEDDLREAGLTILEQQRAFSWAKYQISGNIDLKLALNEELLKSANDSDACPPEIRERLMVELLSRMDGRAMAVVPVEIKSSAPYSFASVNSIKDIKRHKYHYMRKYLAQLTLYLLMDNKEIGLFLFKDKVKGQLKEIWMMLDYEFAESLVKKAEAINQHVADGTLPEPMEYSEEICPECPFAHICMPLRIGEEITITDDNELLELVNRYDALKPGAKEYEEVDKRITELVKGKEKILVGDWFIEGHWQQRANYNIPKELKEQYKEVSQYWLKKIIKAS